MTSASINSPIRTLMIIIQKGMPPKVSFETWIFTCTQIYNVFLYVILRVHRRPSPNKHTLTTLILTDLFLLLLLRTNRSVFFIPSVAFTSISILENAACKIELSSVLLSNIIVWLVK